MYWETLLAPVEMQAHMLHTFTELNSLGCVSHIKINLHPDGGFQSSAGVWDSEQRLRSKRAEFSDFLESAGFQTVDIQWLLAHQLGRVTARKPGAASSCPSKKE